MKTKKVMLRIFLAAEIILFSYAYLFGKNGLYVLQERKEEIKKLDQEILQLQKEVAQLEEEIEKWETDDFYKEKIAREQLQMARKNDEIFYVG